MKAKRTERTQEEKEKALREALAQAEIAGVDLEDLAGREQGHGSGIEVCVPGLPPDRRRDPGT
jgi:hypothetical protein